MKYLIASDIHGSAYYCRKVLEQFEKEAADKIILLGDILYHGPRNDLPKEYNPKAVTEMLNSVKDKIFCVRGNCEAEVDQMVLDFPVLADYALLCEQGTMIFITHGHLYNLADLPKIGPKDILLHGHTHVPALEATEHCIYMNPGSTSLPKEDSLPSYMTLENGHFLWKSLETGDIYKEYTLSEK